MVQILAVRRGVFVWRLEDVCRESLGLVGIVSGFNQRLGQRFHEALEVGESRPALDPHSLALIGDFGGMTRRTIHSDPFFRMGLGIFPLQLGLGFRALAVVALVDGKTDWQTLACRRMTGACRRMTG